MKTLSCLTQSVRVGHCLLSDVFEAVVSVPHSNLLFFPSLFSSMMDPSQVLSPLSHQLTSPFTTQGAGWLVAG